MALLLVSVAAVGQERCHLGAYRDRAGHVLALTAMEGNALRFYLLDGRSGLLTPVAGSTGETYIAGPEWSESTPVVATAHLGSCNAQTIQFDLQGGPSGQWRKIPLHVQNVRFDSGGTSLAAVWVEPAGKQKAPGVVFVHGSGATASIDVIPWQWLLPAEGISMLVFDKRGTGASNGQFTQNFETLATDVAAAVGEARRMGGKRLTQVGVAGFSQGGWVAPLAATHTPVDFVIVGYGVVGSPVEQDIWQVSYQLQQKGFGPGELAKAQRVTTAVGAFVSSGYQSGLETVTALQKEYASEPWLAQIDGQYSGEILQGEIQRAKDESPEVIWNYDAEAVLRAVKVPQLWMMAAADSVAPSAPSIERLRQLQSEHVPIDLALFPDTDHGVSNFRTLPDGKRRRTRLAEGYFPLQIDWVKRHLQPPYGKAQLTPAPSR
jgi:uncharacterized protein